MLKKLRDLMKGAEDMRYPEELNEDYIEIEEMNITI